MKINYQVLANREIEDLNVGVKMKEPKDLKGLAQIDKSETHNWISFLEKEVYLQTN